MKFGDFFPEDDRREHIHRNLSPGSILFLDCPFTIPPKPKFCIVLCIDPEPILALVNSKINAFIAARPDFRDCQVWLCSDHHSFLHYDSYIDCTRVFRNLTISEIESQVLKDSNRLKGALTDQEREAVCYAISVARTIERQAKEWVAKALSLT